MHKSLALFPTLFAFLVPNALADPATPAPPAPTVTAPATSAPPAPLPSTPIPSSPAVPAALRTPAQTKVLMLPALDETGDKKDMQEQHVRVGNHRVEYEFLTRGFPMLSLDVAVATAQRDDIDLSDTDSRTHDSLLRLGTDAGADWVVSLSVVQVYEQNVSNLANGYNEDNKSERRARARVRLRVLDVHTGQFLFNDFHEDTRTKQSFFGRIGTGGLFKQAVDTTVQRAVDQVLKPYASIRKIDGEYDENDLLSSRTAQASTSDKTR